MPVAQNSFDKKKSVCFVLLSTLDHGYKSSRLRRIIPFFQKKGWDVHFIGLGSKKSLKGVCPDQVFMTKIPERIIYAIKLLDKVFPLFKNYNRYHLKEKLFGIYARFQLRKINADVYFCLPRPTSIVSYLKKKDKFVLLEYAESHPFAYIDILRREYVYLDLPCNQSPYLNKKMINEAVSSAKKASDVITLSSYSKNTFTVNEMLTTLIPQHEENFISSWSNDKEIMFVCTAHHNVIKGTHRLLQVWSQLKIKNAKLFIAGPLNADMQQFVNINGPYHDVIFVGSLSKKEMFSLYSRYNFVGILYSLAEGMPRVVFEYLQFGFPCIVSKAATCDIIENELNGYVVDYGDDTALRDSIKHAIDNQDLLFEYSSNIKNYFESSTLVSYEESLFQHTNECLHHENYSKG